MITQNIFLNYLLLFILINLVVLYLYQNLDYYCQYFDISSGLCKDKNNNVGNSNQSGNLEKFNLDNQTDTNNVLLPINNNKQRILSNKMGVKQSFHNHFKPHMPELGWREFYLKLNGGVDQVCELQEDCKTNFRNVITRNFLNNLENTDNVYKNVNY